MYINNDSLLSNESLLKSHDSFGDYVDNVIKKSFNRFSGRECKFCADLLSKGKSTKSCPKAHHKFNKI